MVPRATRADLHYVAARALVRGGHAERCLQRPDAAVVALQAVRVDVRQEAKVLVLADGTLPLGLLSDVTGRAHQLRVGVADLHPGKETVADIAEQRPLGEGVVHDAEGAWSHLGGHPGTHVAAIVAGGSVAAGAPPSA